jgi:hypothetical protein
MTFDPTTRYGLVRQVLTDPEIYDYMTDDFAPAREEFQVNTHSDIRYVRVYDGFDLLGLFCLFPENQICWAAHVALYRGLHPEKARRIGRELVEWLWENTPCRRLIASVPASNWAAVRYGLDAQGMNLEPYGMNSKSFLKHGKLWDQMLMGRSKPGE